MFKKYNSKGQKYFFDLFVFVLLFFHSAICISQPTNQDCINAIPVCQSIYYQPNAYNSEGFVLNEINPLLSCLNTGEVNGVWYTFTVVTSGLLSFTIFPNDSLSDYDWAVYNLTNNSCTQIQGNLTLEVGCNYSANLPGCSGTTGANGNTLGTCGVMNGPTINVTLGETFVLYVSSYSSGANQNGYTLDFTASSATLYDTIPPQINPLQNIVCGNDSIEIVFNENVLCSSLQQTDFQLTGPLGNLVINSLSSDNCSFGSNYAQSLKIKLNANLVSNGQYTLTIIDTITDLCGNNIVIPSSAIFNLNCTGTSLNNLANSQDYLTIVPNPATGEVKMAFSNGQEILSCLIFDFTGKKVFDCLSINNVINFNTKVLSNGLYTVLVKVKDGKYFTQKIQVSN